MFHIVIQRIQ